MLLFFILTADMPFKAGTVAGLKRHILAGSYIIPTHVSATAKQFIELFLVQVGGWDHQMIFRYNLNYNIFLWNILKSYWSLYMDTSEPKWGNPDGIWYGVN